MRGTGWRAACGATLLLGAAQAHAGGNVMGSVGVRAMDDGYWAPVESQAVLGLLASMALGAAPIHAVLGLQFSGADAEAPAGFEHEASTVEWSAGLRFMPQSGVVRPYGGVGGVSTRVDFETRNGSVTIDDDDSASGLYVEGGLLWRVARHLDVGGNLRYVGGTDVELFGVEGDADALVLTALVGYGWGGDHHRRRGGGRD